MNESNLTTKVGAFVVVAIMVLAAVLLVFSKGSMLFAPTYTLRLRAESVGGLKTRSAVLISGVTVGSVAGTELSPTGKGVTIFARIYKRYAIHRDAQFVVEQIGLLGDQYVVIYPRENKGPLLKDGDEAECRPPFNVQELARSSVGFLERVDETTRSLKEAVGRLNNLLFTEKTLTNLSQSLVNFRTVSDKAITFMDQLNSLLATNTTPLTASLTNIARLSQELNKLNSELRETVAENRAGLASVVKSLEDSAHSISGLAKDLESGHGLAGSLLKDEQLRQNLSVAMANLATATSNMANYGLLYKPKKPKPESVQRFSAPSHK